MNRLKIHSPYSRIKNKRIEKTDDTDASENTQHAFTFLCLPVPTSKVFLIAGILFFSSPFSSLLQQ